MSAANEVIIAGHALWEFHAKMLSYPVFETQIDQEIFQGTGRSSFDPLHVRQASKRMRFSLDFHGSNDERTWNQSQFEALLFTTEPVEIDIGDGFFYRGAIQSISDGMTVGELITTVEYTFRISRHTTPMTVEISASDFQILCPSTVEKTDCVWTIPLAGLSGESNVTFVIGDCSWRYSGTITGDIVLDGVNKIFTMGGENITNDIVWTDFPYLSPGLNVVSVFVGIWPAAIPSVLKFTPTYQ